VGGDRAVENNVSISPNIYISKVLELDIFTPTI
jgi:hypothetical protein